MNVDRSSLAARDLDDPLAPFRERFALPDGIVYLDGNSLGPLPRATPEALRRAALEEWGCSLITSWNRHDWIGLPQRVARTIARIIGAAPDEVAVADSTSVNLFKVLAAGLGLRPGRRVILAERHNFPTDLYIAQGLRDLLGGGIELRLIDRPADIGGSLGSDVAILMLTHIDYRTGRMHDMAAITAAAHAAGALALWDLAHSAGAVPLDLAGCGADLAVGCGYKYLNGGPGAPAFLFVARRHLASARTPIAGWMGHAQPFAFTPEYRPAGGIDRFLAGTPAILALEALRIGAELVAEADMALVRAKSVALADAFMTLAEAKLTPYGFTVASPRAAAERGSQVSLEHPDGYPIMQALIARGVIGDFRPPNLLRFGFTPLYTRYVDVAIAIDALADIMTTGAWDEPQFRERAKVT